MRVTKRYVREPAAVSSVRARRWSAVAVLLLGASAGCTIKHPNEQHFYDQHIQPTFNNFCVGNTSPCHRIDPATGIALGNLDLSSFDSVQKRRDVLRTYGSYPQPLLLLKALPEENVLIPYGNTDKNGVYQQRLLPSEIRHTGGKPIALNSDAYFELKRWLDNGANRDGLLPAPKANSGLGSCNTVIPPGRPTPDTSSPAFQTFVDKIQPKLLASCAYATCHSSPQSDFYLTCGTDDAQIAFNFQQASSFVIPMGAAVEQSEILLRPLSPSAGGVSHTGGTFFLSRDDDTWKEWHD